jgi:hypothetical protein
MRDSNALSRAWGYLREIVHQIHSGEEDMRAVYGDNPNHVSDENRVAGAAALSNLANFGNGS